ncbi:hypothetical protein [Devosia sp. SL43]|uniref:hypothetical protein n=1 Tax=Devosia sp. SL43 TaxID=2806348 RepID=UPI001F2D8F0F|nr:hypothetical protein [Devosia sp. SL43]UJW86510.1 hypothetical protein IM737_04375 [Devosia sp. SL43]
MNSIKCAGLVSGLFVALSATLTPVQATEIRTAIRLCDANPNCTYTMNDGDGGIDIIVGDNIIYCAEAGECACVSCPPPARIAGAPGKGPFLPTSVSKLLQSGPAVPSTR